jgi:hypothetical protein
VLRKAYGPRHDERAALEYALCELHGLSAEHEFRETRGEVHRSIVAAAHGAQKRDSCAAKVVSSESAPGAGIVTVAGILGPFLTKSSRRIPGVFCVRLGLWLQVSRVRTPSVTPHSRGN